MFSKYVSVSFIGFLFLIFSSWAGASGLEGIVKDPKGHPIQGANVRVEAKNGTKFSKVVKTDASGHYTADLLPAGVYKVTLVINGSVKASILNASTQSGKNTKLNFELTQKTGPSKTHMVYVPAETGTHIGGGRWIEVDEQGRVVGDASGASSVERNSGESVRRMITDHVRSPQGP